MRTLAGLILILEICLLPLSAGNPKASSSAADDQNSLVIVFKDGRQKTYAMSDIARIEVNTSKPPAPAQGQNRFQGKWKVGDGSGGSFFITLERDGGAKKSIGASHGTWVVVDGEARISWDDGWHDALRKTDHGYEKAAFAPGKSFSDEADNVTKAENTEAHPL
jgi:hypothetical protein